MLAVALLLAGCAARQTAALLEERPGFLTSSADVAGVPFHPQQRYQCGPAALAMALGWAGVQATPGLVAPKVFIPGRQGSLQVEMQAAARRHGMLAYVLAPKLADLLAEVGSGHPVIVFQNLGFGWYPLWHYAVLIAYDLNSGRVVLHSGTQARRVLPLSTFERTWSRAGSWAMLVLPAERLPLTASERGYLRAVLALEQSGNFRAAAAAYTAALGRWPHSLVARVGEGNSYYAMGDLEQAERSFLQAATEHPGSAAAFNNLAQTRFERGYYRQALTAAEEAVRLDPATPAYGQTLAQIRDRLPAGPSSP